MVMIEWVFISFSFVLGLIGAVTGIMSLISVYALKQSTHNVYWKTADDVVTDQQKSIDYEANLFDGMEVLQSQIAREGVKRGERTVNI
jgi:hypothetical protein